MEYIKPGTIGYIKDTELNIRQVRCLDYEIDGVHIYPVKWEIAGSGKIFYTDENGFTSHLRKDVFPTAESAYNGIGDIECNAEFDEKTLAKKFYPKARLYQCKGSRKLEAQCCRVRADMFIEQVNVHDIFHFQFTKDSVTPRLPMVDKGEYFLTYEDAAASRHTPEVISFDDEPTQESAETQHQECADADCIISNGSSKQPRLAVKFDESRKVFFCIGTSLMKDWASNPTPFVEPLITLNDFEENGFAKEEYERSLALEVGESWETDFPDQGVFIMRVQ